MAMIEIGKDYRNGRGMTISIVADAKTEDGGRYYLGVHRDPSRMVGMDCYYYTVAGRIAIGGTSLDDLQVFDWCSLKKDEVVWIQPSFQSKAMARHVHYVDLERDLIYYYGDGVSSLTYDAMHHQILKAPASAVRGLVKS